jgi:hypothetical protein
MYYPGGGLCQKEEDCLAGLVYSKEKTYYFFFDPKKEAEFSFYNTPTVCLEKKGTFFLHGTKQVARYSLVKRGPC